MYVLNVIHDLFFVYMIKECLAIKLSEKNGAFFQTVPSMIDIHWSLCAAEEKKIWLFRRKKFAFLHIAISQNKPFNARNSLYLIESSR